MAAAVLDSPNHKDHVAYGVNNTCPPSHPVKIPAITFDIQYPAKGTPEGYFLSSDPEGKRASSMHGDAFVMWDVNTMNERTKISRLNIGQVLHRLQHGDRGQPPG